MKRISIALVALAAIVTGSALGQPGDAQAQADPAPRPDVFVDVLIAFDRTPGPAEQAFVRGAGGQIKHTFHLVPAIAASVPQGAIQGLLNNPRVAAVDADGRVHAIDHDITTSDAELEAVWGVEHIGSGAVHAGGNNGLGVRVAIIDSGIGYTHADLDANYAGGYDFVNDDADPMDDNGHGTHVAGAVAAEDDDAGVVGVAPDASLYGLKVLNASGSGSWSDIIAALQWAVDNGVQVTNSSYGSGTNPGGTVQAAFDNSAAAGILHVAAAGNTGNPKGKGNSVGWPARYDSVIAVAATDSSDNRARFSSTGDQVELAAPGVAVNSAKLGGGYIEFNGTSMASPHVAGTAALLIAAGITDSNGDGNINDEIRIRLQETADDLGDPGRDSLYGFGLVHADEAADIGPPNDAPAVSITSPADGSTFDSGASILFEGTVSDTEDGDLTASLAWTSDLIGPIGAGGSFSTTLSDGTHTITASVTDSGGKTGSASISLTVGNPPAEATSVSVDSITYATDGGKNQDKHLGLTVTLVDDLGNLVANASVSVDLSRDGSSVASGTGTIDADGTVTFTLNSAASGCYHTDVTDVQAGGLLFDGSEPANEFCK